MDLQGRLEVWACGESIGLFAVGQCGGGDRGLGDGGCSQGSEGMRGRVHLQRCQSCLRREGGRAW